MHPIPSRYRKPITSTCPVVHTRVGSLYRGLWLPLQYLHLAKIYRVTTVIISIPLCNSDIWLPDGTSPKGLTIAEKSPVLPASILLPPCKIKPPPPLIFSLMSSPICPKYQSQTPSSLANFSFCVLSVLPNHFHIPTFHLHNHPTVHTLKISLILENFLQFNRILQCPSASSHTQRPEAKLSSKKSVVISCKEISTPTYSPSYMSDGCSNKKESTRIWSHSIATLSVHWCSSHL